MCLIRICPPGLEARCSGLLPVEGKGIEQNPTRLTNICWTSLALALHWPSTGADVFTVKDGKETLRATTLSTIMVMHDKADSPSKT